MILLPFIQNSFLPPPPKFNLNKLYYLFFHLTVTNACLGRWGGGYLGSVSTHYSGESMAAGVAWFLVVGACGMAYLVGSGKRELDLKWN